MTNRKGFTLIELMVVIAVIGILAAVALISLTGLQKSARDSARRSNMSDYATALARYYQDNQAYPAQAGAGADNDNAGTGIFSATSVLVSSNYMPKVLKDPVVGTSACKLTSASATQTCQYSYFATVTNFTLFAIMEAPSASNGVFYITDKGSRANVGVACTAAVDATNCP